MPNPTYQGIMFMVAGLGDQRQAILVELVMVFDRLLVLVNFSMVSPCPNLLVAVEGHVVASKSAIGYKGPDSKLGRMTFLSPARQSRDV